MPCDVFVSATLHDMLSGGSLVYNRHEKHPYLNKNKEINLEIHFTVDYKIFT